MRLGAPQKIERDELSPHASSPDHVVLHANWKTADGIPVGLSLYGAPRATRFGDSAGSFYLSWGDLEAAAAPWLKEWHAANEAVAQAAQSPGSITRYSVAYDVRASDARDPHRIANRCLNAPGAARHAALDRARPRGPGLRPVERRSGHALAPVDVDLHDRAGRPDTSRVRVASVEPARGGGFSSIDIGGWWARDAWKSRAIEEAVHAIERVPGLTIERSSGHDV
jgi:hypothetical protein